jgi:hypothetical protein
MDVALATDGDILIGPNGLEFVSGLAAIAQAVRFRSLLFRAEWFLNLDIGVPYFEDLIGDASKSPDLKARAHAAFAAVILDVPGIVAILQLDIDVDNGTRTMTITWAAQTLFGDTPTTVLSLGEES